MNLAMYYIMLCVQIVYCVMQWYLGGREENDDDVGVKAYTHSYIHRYAMLIITSRQYL